MENIIIIVATKKNELVLAEKLYNVEIFLNWEMRKNKNEYDEFKNCG